MEVGLLAAFAAGVLSLLSPCSALLLPAFFAYAFASPARQVLRTLAFYAGLLLTLVPLGAGAGLAGEVFYGHRQTLITVAGWSIIAMGVLLLLGRGFRLPFTDRLQRLVAARTSARAGILSTVLLGAVYGLAGFCSGPILGAILTVAITRDTPLAGAVLLAVYALGMAVPLFVLALLWDRLDLGRRPALRGRMLHLGPVRVHSTMLVAGLLFVLVGGLFLRFDGTAGLPGLFGDTAELEWSAQEWIQRVLGPVPAWAVMAGLTAVAALWLAARWRADRRG